MWLAVAMVAIPAIMEEEEPPLPAIAALFAFAMLFALLQVSSFFVAWREREQIKATGIPAKATILNITTTGTEINDEPLIRIELEVQPPYDERFVTTVEYVVPSFPPPDLQKGKVIRVFWREGTRDVAIEGL
jgi:hypothetical protein